MQVYWKERHLGEISLQQCKAGRDLLVPFALLGSYYLRNGSSCQGISGAVTFVLTPLFLDSLDKVKANAGPLRLEEVRDLTVGPVALSLLFSPFQRGRWFLDGIGGILLWDATLVLFRLESKADAADIEFASCTSLLIAHYFSFLSFCFLLKKVRPQGGAWSLVSLVQAGICFSILYIPLIGALAYWRSRSELGYKRAARDLLLLFSQISGFLLYTCLGDSPAGILSYAAFGRGALCWSGVDEEARLLRRVSINLELAAAVMAGVVAYVDPRPGYLKASLLCASLPLYTFATWMMEP